ncbi:hypothetical protein BJ322DRAFT_1173523 [Thelephora terrestris]|uniref:Uncharacterized protein n=1 Tax=Thelephora terrestris TaxID=56493 RepID=A0A9P6H4I5_9AGAM|nr:hypothetical protein BJ322DRAFT_1173523 [Thelephora terrestris]
MSLNATATPFVSVSYKDDTPYDVEQHLYDTPTNIAQDNKVAVDFLTAHNAPSQFWEQAGYEDPNRTQRWAPGVSPLRDAMEQEREDRIRKLEGQMDVMNLSSAISGTSAEGHIVLTPFLTPPLSLRHHQDQGVPLPQSPPWSPAPVPQMVARTSKKECKSPMTRSGQWCCPSSKSHQVQMRLKLEVASLQEKYGFDLVHEGLDSVRKDMFDGLEHDVLGC